MLSNSPLQPWFDYGTAISHTAYRTDPFAALPPIQPCYGGSVGGKTLNCSAVCDESYLLFDPQHPENLVTCGLWATVGAILLQSGPLPATTPFDAVGLNVSSLEPVGIVDGGLAGNNALQRILVSCFASFYAGTHDFTQHTRDTPSSCSAFAMFQNPLQVEPCFEDLCAPRTLGPDFGGIGVCSGKSASAALED